MSTVTKLALTQINTRLTNENAELRARVSQLQSDLVNVTSVASAINSVPQWQTDRATAMSAAKAEAMTTHRIVMTR